MDKPPVSETASVPRTPAVTGHRLRTVLLDLSLLPFFRQEDRGSVRGGDLPTFHSRV